MHYSVWTCKNATEIMAKEVNRVIKQDTSNNSDNISETSNKESEITKAMDSLTINSKSTQDIEHKCQVCGKKAVNICSACKLTFYCSSACQRKDWPTHKIICKKAKRYLFHFLVIFNSTTMRKEIIRDVLPNLIVEISILNALWDQKSADKGAIIIDCLDWTKFEGEGKLGECNLFFSFCRYNNHSRKDLSQIISDESKLREHDTMHIICCDGTGYNYL